MAHSAPRWDSISQFTSRMCRCMKPQALSGLSFLFIYCKFPAILRIRKFSSYFSNSTLPYLAPDKSSLKTCGTKQHRERPAILHPRDSRSTLAAEEKTSLNDLFAAIPKGSSNESLILHTEMGFFKMTS